MFNGLSAIWRSHCIQKERPRIKIDNGRADDPHGTYLSAGKIRFRHRSTYIPLPDNAAIRSIQRIHVIRFGHHNDHWTVWTTLDVKRLRVNVA